MSYKPWPLLYRPQQFKDYTSHANNLLFLKNAILQQKIPHCFIFLGSRGLGKTSLARTFSMALNCPNKQDGYEPCLTCESCVTIKESRSIDVIEMDAASNRGIADVKKICQAMNHYASIGEWRVAIIDECHALTAEAWQAFLKTLEEPPEKSLFIFCTTEADSVPETVLSRAVPMDFKRVPPPQIAERLEFICKEQNVPYDKEALLEIGAAANGGMRDSVNILEQTYISQGTITIHALSQIGAISDLRDALKLIELAFSNEVEEGLTFIRSTIGKYRTLNNYVDNVARVMSDVALHRYGGASPRIQVDVVKNLENLAEQNGIKFANLYEVILSSVRDIGQYGKSPYSNEAFAQMMFLRWVQILKGEVTTGQSTMMKMEEPGRLAKKPKPITAAEAQQRAQQSQQSPKVESKDDPLKGIF